MNSYLHGRSLLRARMLAIACGYEDADDLDHLRTDPGVKLACGRLPDTGRNLCSQPTVSRWENAPSLREVMRLSYAMVDAYCASYARPPAAVTLDIDDAVDVVHGHQQLSLFNAHHDERCFMPIHVYDIQPNQQYVYALPLLGRHVRSGDSRLPDVGLATDVPLPAMDFLFVSAQPPNWRYEFTLVLAADVNQAASIEQIMAYVAAAEAAR